MKSPQETVGAVNWPSEREKEPVEEEEAGAGGIKQLAKIQTLFPHQG